MMLSTVDNTKEFCCQAGVKAMFNSQLKRVLYVLKEK